MKLYRATYTNENGVSCSTVAMPRPMLGHMYDSIQDYIDCGSWVESFVADVSADEWDHIEQSYKQA